MNAGQDFIGGEICDHYAFRQGKIDWQIWIATAASRCRARSSSPTATTTNVRSRFP